MSGLFDKVVSDEYKRLRKLGLYPSSSKFAKAMNNANFPFALPAMQAHIMEAQAALKDMFIADDNKKAGKV